MAVLLLQRKALRRPRRRGITLIEAALVLSLTGVVVAAFVPTFIEHVHTSKLAEATQMLDALHRHAASYYAREHLVGNGAGRGCLPESAGPYPLEPSAEPVSVDFTADEQGKATWLALGLAQPAQLRYSYEVNVSQAGCNGRQLGVSMTFRAHGDLDEDDVHSLLERTSVVKVEAAQATLVPSGPLRIIARTE